MKKIFETLEYYKQDAESKGLIVYAIALKGSQNYNLDDKESDIDANLVFIPTLEQLRTNNKCKYEYESGEVTCHNIYSFAEIVAKDNPQWVEVCNTEYIIGDLSLFSYFNLNPSAVKGMIMEKVHAFSKLYPSRRKYVEEFGYDPKQLHHIIRLYDLLKSGKKTFKYSDEDKKLMLDIKRGRFPSTVKEAEELRDSYLDKLSIIYDDIKNSYKAQEVNYKQIDEIVITYLCRSNHV